MVGGVVFGPDTVGLPSGYHGGHGAPMVGLPMVERSGRK